MDYIWHKVSEEEKEEIRKQAKKVMEDFSRKLEKVSSSSELETREMRPESQPWRTPDDFRDTMLSNAPDTGEGFIVAEKGAWK